MARGSQRDLLGKIGESREDRVGLFYSEDHVSIIGAASTERGYMNFADIIYQVYEKASTI